MDRLAPLEIDHANLATSALGYNRSQVDVLLTRVKTEMNGLLEELDEAKSEIRRQKALLEKYAANEGTVKDTLIVAQRASDDVRAAAQREADSIVAKAHRTAEETQRQYQAKINDLRWELERTRMDRQKIQADFRAVLENYMRKLTEVESIKDSTNSIEPSESIRAVIDGQM